MSFKYPNHYTVTSAESLIRSCVLGCNLRWSQDCVELTARVALHSFPALSLFAELLEDTELQEPKLTKPRKHYSSPNAPVF